MNSKKDFANAIKKLKLLVFTPKSNVDIFRDRMEKAFSNVFLPNRVECSEVDYGGIKCDFLSPEIYSSKKLLLYIHGGSFVGGSRSVYRTFCATIANVCSCRLILPEFRLAPTHAFPAALEDLQSMYRSLYTEEQITQALNDDSTDINGEKRLPEIYIMADGSGASLALALMHSLNGKFRTSVKQIILFSPWLDLREKKLERKTLKAIKGLDEVLTFEDLKMAGDVYTYHANLENPQVSPIAIDDKLIEDFPPIYIQMGENEILRYDVDNYIKLLSKAGVEYTLDIWEGMPFMFQMADEFLEESHLAIEKIGKILK